MKALLIRESQLRRFVNNTFRLLREREELSNVVSIFRNNNASQSPTQFLNQSAVRSIKISGVVEFIYNEGSKIDDISKFLANVLEGAAVDGAQSGLWSPLEVDGDISSVAQFDRFFSKNGLAIVSPFELIHKDTNHFKFFVEFLSEPNEEDERVESYLLTRVGTSELKELIKRDLTGSIKRSFRNMGARQINIKLY